MTLQYRKYFDLKEFSFLLIKMHLKEREDPCIKKLNSEIKPEFVK